MSMQCDYSSQGNHKILFIIGRSMSVYVLLLPLLLLIGLYKGTKFQVILRMMMTNIFLPGIDETELKMTYSAHCRFWMRTTKQSLSFENYLKLLENFFLHMESSTWMARIFPALPYRNDCCHFSRASRTV